ncbi:MAG: hypothetical protein WBM83_06695 [Flavobacteriaceae bacterium]
MCFSRLIKIFDECPYIDECYLPTQESGAAGIGHQANAIVDESYLNLLNLKLWYLTANNKFLKKQF